MFSQLNAHYAQYDRKITWTARDYFLWILSIVGINGEGEMSKENNPATIKTALTNFYSNFALHEWISGKKKKVLPILRYTAIFLVVPKKMAKSLNNIS